MENMSKDLEKAEASEIIGPISTETTTNEVLDLNKDLEAGLAETDEEHVQVECRICQEEDFMDKLEAPCLCNGTLKFAHRNCIQRWINERLSMICEICKQPYQPDYTMVLPPPQDVQAEDLCCRDGYFTFNNTPAAVQAQRAAHIDAAAAEYMRRQQAYNARAFSGSAVCRIGAVICLAFLVVKDVYYFIENGEESDLVTIFCVMFGFFIPCYLLAWFAKALNQNEGDSAASEVAIASQSSVPVASQSSMR
ncbi:unnamed protein product [Prunus armeniaca]|uniref:RING-CH-type domain-containing protein n=1 Tax=Prunus armeniaca TaxID=36596 RepID=A0A6J5UFD1_PRUAR|nr:unnamed protein product [Prunus armeniaca]CAB4305412.1 unnamed protein product [Prunus armeniaca]